MSALRKLMHFGFNTSICQHPELYVDLTTVLENYPSCATSQGVNGQMSRLARLLLLGRLLLSLPYKHLLYLCRDLDLLHCLKDTKANSRTDTNQLQGAASPVKDGLALSLSRVLQELHISCVRLYLCLLWCGCFHFVDQ